jgi:hypothetical protein
MLLDDILLIEEKMMKKLILLLAVLILAAGLCFAQEEAAAEDASAEAKPEFFDLEVTVGVPIHWTNSPNDHVGVDIDKTVTADTAIGIGLLWNFSQKFGLTVDMDVFFGSSVMGRSGDSSDSNTLFGANALIGPVIYLYNGSFLRIPLALGAHLYYWSGDHWDETGTSGNWLKYRDFQVGPGAYLGIQFHFNDNIYIFSRTNVAVMVFRWHEGATGGGSDSEVDVPILGWHVKPSLGIGIKF